jgi:hypothetical protein
MNCACRIISTRWLRVRNLPGRGLHVFPGWFRIVRNVKTKTLQIGQPAPLFSLADADMESVALAAFKGK